MLAAIYLGAIKNWSQVGGPDLAITVVDRALGSGTQSVFVDRVLGDNGRVTVAAAVAADANEMARIVNEEVGATVTPALHSSAVRNL